MKLVTLPAFADNYIWMLHDGHQALVVDPGDAAPVREALAALDLRLTGILVTHHHGDHVGGLRDLQDLLEGPIWGPSDEPMPLPVTACRDGDTLSWAGCHFRTIAVPGHTLGHLAFFWDGRATAQQGPDEAPLLFCGDTLFSAGCGRLFEGTAAQMHASLQRLAELPADTRVCCAHEYTQSNLRFAAAVEPDNAAVSTHAAHCADLRAQGLPTLPSTLASERAINPFLRCTQPAVVAAARRREPEADADAVGVLATLRTWKNQFQ